MAAGNGRNGNEAVASTASEAFGKWLHRMTPSNCHRAYRFSVQYPVKQIHFAGKSKT